MVVAEVVEPALMDAKQAAKYCALSKGTWYRRLSAGQIPRPLKIGDLSRWRKSALDDWIANGCPVLSGWNMPEAKE